MEHSQIIEEEHKDPLLAEVAVVEVETSSFLIRILQICRDNSKWRVSCVAKEAILYGIATIDLTIISTLLLSTTIKMVIQAQITNTRGKSQL